MKQWWRTALVTILVALTGIVAPVSVVAAWAHTQVGDTEAFVAAYAPLSRDPAVQQALAAKLSSTIQDRLDLPSLAQRFIDSQVDGFVSSDAFSQAWTVALRASHTQFAALISGDDSGALTLDSGVLQLQLGPFVEAMKHRLVANGFPLAERIPPVTTAIDLVQLNPQAVAWTQAGYRLLAVVADWLPWLLLLLPALALFLARDLRHTVIACGAAVAAGIAVAWLAFRAAVGGGMAVAAADGIPDAAVTAITDSAFGPMRGPALAIGVLGLVVAFVGAMTARPASA